VVQASSSLGQFARGSHDEFVYPKMPFLGQLTQLRVGTSGEGLFAQWHLRTVEVTHLGSGQRWLFNCHDWINKACRWQRVLSAQAM
ncbi:uncharacterized protein HaLaN_28979, partial [Haematococcus lacustris]